MLNIKGMSIESIMSLSNKYLSSLSRKELSKIVSRLASASNKRIVRFERRNETSPAYEQVKKSGKFSVRGKDINALKKEFLRAKSFLSSETSTIKGATKVRKEVQRKLQEKGVIITNEQYTKFFKVYEKLKELDSSVSDKLMKYKVFEEINNELDDKKNIDEITLNIYDKLKDIYEEQADYDTDFSKYFKID